MKTLTLIVLLTTSQFAYAMAEDTCLARSIYFEARDQTPAIWGKVARVALNRKKLFKEFKLSKQSLCTVVMSKDYTTRYLIIRGKIKEKELYEKIKLFVKKGKFASSNVYYFSGKGKLHFSKKKNLSDSHINSPFHPCQKPWRPITLTRARTFPFHLGKVPLFHLSLSFPIQTPTIIFYNYSFSFKNQKIKGKTR